LGAGEINRHALGKVGFGNISRLMRDLLAALDETLS